jgi:glycosyltransferase involved in cell wall biosynthesis
MKKQDDRPTILMIGPLPPPLGGQSILISNILNSGLASRFCYVVMNVSHDSPGVGKRLVLAVFFACRLILILITNPAIKLLHIHTSAGIAFFEKSLFVTIGKLFGKKVILHVHGGKFRSFWDNATGRKKNLIRSLLNLNDALIVLGVTWKTFYEDEVKCRCKVAVLVNAIKVHPIAQSAKSDVVTFLYVGHLKREKGVLDLLEALLAMPESSRQSICLKLMGGGDTQQNEKIVRTAYAEAGLSCVEFLGQLSGDEKWHQFNSANVFVLPSHSEDMPITIIEAMGLGLPVISTDVGGISTMVQDGVNGYLVKPHDVAGLAAKMQLLAEKPDLRLVMGQASKQKYADSYSFGEYEIRLESLYCDLL